MMLIASHRRALTVSLLLVSVGLVAAVAGCSPAPQAAVAARLEVVDRTRSMLSAAAITSITGTYGGLCDGRDVAGTDTWTLSVSGGPAGDELSVRKNDTDCVLTVENILTAGGTFAGSPSLVLDTTNAYKGSASAFAIVSDPVAFYGNAKISALTFGADFTISLLVSDVPNASADPDKAAAFATQNGTVSAGTVAASDYTASLASFSVAKDVNNIVQSVAGYEQLTAGSVAGQDYFVYAGSLTGASTFDAVDALWTAATPTLLSALTTLRIPASEYALTGVDLGTSPARTVVVRNTVAGVSSYQLLLVTFVP